MVGLTANNSLVLRFGKSDDKDRDISWGKKEVTHVRGTLISRTKLFLCKIEEVFGSSYEDIYSSLWNVYRIIISKSLRALQDNSQAKFPTYLYMYMYASTHTRTRERERGRLRWIFFNFQMHVLFIKYY